MRLVILYIEIGDTESCMKVEGERHRGEGIDLKAI